MQAIKYKRVLIKLSGESLMGSSAITFDKPTIDNITRQIKELIELNVKVGIVVGGGNIFRGINGPELGIQRANADYMGMLATIMNGIALKDFLNNTGIKSKIYSSLTVTNITKGYSRDSMLSRIDDNVILFVGGTGNPYFTTDSSAALRAIDMGADLIIKATKVDGVYDCDPVKNKNAKKYTSLTFDEAINKNLKVMDISAFELCREHKINIEVSNIFNQNCLKDSVFGNNHGTIITF